ncbi:MAG TPA: DUF1819 family protein [Spirochaetales bacterium]|nr:DUF1819 family protein [Spirochaetales bacterium]
MSSTYTTGLIKGSGLIDETLSLLDLWEPQTDGRKLADLAVAKNVISKATAKRTKDIVREFSYRYLVGSGTAAPYLKTLVQSSVSLNRLKQILIIYTSRAHPILYDFIFHVYWDRVRNNCEYLENRDAQRFLHQALLNGNIDNRWTDEVIKKISTRLLTCLRDFDYISADTTLKRRIVPYSILPLTAMFLSHEIHFSGFSDNSILESPDWALFGIFGKADVVNVLKQASRDEVFILQYSGDLLRISWKYNTMEELLHAFTRREL